MSYSRGYVDPCSHVFGVSRRFGSGRKGCSFYTGSSFNSSRFFVKANERTHSFASDLTQENYVGGIGGLDGSPAPCCSRNQSLNEKLVVAVDVDEGMLNRSVHLIH